MSQKLLLFDIDGTLVDTGGAGMTALTETALELFGSEGPALDLAGSTDSGIFRGLCEHYGRQPEEGFEDDFYAAYLPKLRENLKEPSFGGRILPGVREVLEKVQAQGHVLGLLTGNIAEGARIKVEHYELDHFFSFGAYGDDHWDRNRLGPIALDRAFEAKGQRFHHRETIVIGDTPKDVACAQALGAKCVAVATGQFSVVDLQATGAELVLESLGEFSLPVNNEGDS